MATPRYEVAYSDLAEAWRIWDARMHAWCRLGRPPELGPADLVAVVSGGIPAGLDAIELCWHDRHQADRWLIHCYQVWGQIPRIHEPHAGDLVLGFAAA